MPFDTRWCGSWAIQAAIDSWRYSAASEIRKLSSPRLSNMCPANLPGGVIAELFFQEAVGTAIIGIPTAVLPKN